ncbi:hypothetical protein UFOVP758_14 [uncultured Caudovirales phage]|uniref:Major tropism determinant N-terminal domain-containing protein n=1 Tax=uncultured Caudovirales phage TaxID=2100421 RepID=A0A6J7X430_9CAUD|nr:hypothetical protein UFOVP758_14 [uncultured Caudovirales phage]
MAIKIKRSSGNLAPTELAAGQLAYSEGSSNGGTLYYGEIGGTVREIGGRKIVDKVNGIEAGAQVNTVASVNSKTGTVVIATTDLSDFNSAVDARITSSKLTTELGYTPENAANKGQANGYASLDSSGLVPSSQLPSYVDDVLEYANLASLPGTGATGKIYVAIDTGKTYRWSGSAYVEISASPGSTDSVTEGSTNLYYTDTRARGALSASQNLSYNSSTGAFTGPDLSTYATGSQLSTLASSLATVATTGSYNDLTNKPSLFSGSYTDLTSKPTLFSGAYADLTGKPSLFSGSFADLSSKPTTLSGYGITDAFSGSYTDLSNKPTLFSGAYGDLTGKPTSITSFGITDGTAGQVLTTNGSGGFTFSNPTGGLANIVEDTTPQLGGDLDIQANKITTSTTNGDVKLQVGGTGDIVLHHNSAAGGYVRVGDGTNPGIITSKGAQDLLFLADPDNEAGQPALQLEVSTGNVVASAGPTGAVKLSHGSGSGVLLSGGGGSSYVGSDTGQDLTIVANILNASTGAVLTLKSGANGNLELHPVGTGSVIVGSGSAAPLITGNGAYALTLTANGQTTTGGPTAPICAGSSFIQVTNGTTSNLILGASGSSSASGGVVVLSTFGNVSLVSRNDGSTNNTGPVLNLRRTRNDVALSAMDGVYNNLTFTVRDNTLASSSYGRMLASYSTSGGHSFQFETSTNSFTASNRLLAVENLTLALGPTTGTQAQTVTTNHAGDLILNTNRGTDSGTIQIFAGANGSISITPNGSGSVILDGLTYPQADGTAGQLLKTNGSGVLSFTSDIDDGTF